MKSSALPDLPTTIPRWGNKLTRGFGRTLVWLSRWKVVGTVPPHLKKAVIPIGPHTSNWDLPLGLIFVVALGLKVSWMGKHTIFRGPLGWFLRALGGIAVERSATHGFVEQITARFDAADAMIFSLSPEGTRSKVSRWKTGFYHIAMAADVPILPISIDFPTRIITIGELLHPTGEIETEIATIKAFFHAAQGARPHLAS